MPQFVQNVQDCYVLMKEYANVQELSFLRIIDSLKMENAKLKREISAFAKKERRFRCIEL